MAAGGAEAQPFTAEVVLRPPDAQVMVKRARASRWTPAAQMQAVGDGDSMHVVEGSAELFFGSGRRVILPAGTMTTAGSLSESEGQRVGGVLAAAVRALLDFVRGDPEPSATSRRSLEATMGLGRITQGIHRLESARREVEPWKAAVFAAWGEHTPLLLLPANTRPWTVVPGAALRWASLSDGLPVARVRIYPAAAEPGCPPVAPAVFDSVVGGDSLRIPESADLEEGGDFRVEAGLVPVRIGCIRLATRAEAERIATTVEELRAEYGPEASSDEAFRVLEAALLAQNGFQHAALESLLPLVRRPAPNRAALDLLIRLLASTERPVRPG